MQFNIPALRGQGQGLGFTSHLQAAKPEHNFMDLEQQIFQDGEDVPSEFLSLSADDIKTRTRLLDNEIRVLKDESTRLSLEQSGLKERIKDNSEKVTQ